MEDPTAFPFSLATTPGAPRASLSPGAPLQLVVEEPSRPSAWASMHSLDYNGLVTHPVEVLAIALLGKEGKKSDILAPFPAKHLGDIRRSKSSTRMAGSASFADL